MKTSVKSQEGMALVFAVLAIILIAAATMRAQAMLWGAAPQQNDEIEAQFDVFGGAPKKGHR